MNQLNYQHNDVESCENRRVLAQTTQYYDEMWDPLSLHFSFLWQDPHHFEH